MKAALPLILLISILAGCATHTEKRQNPELAVIDAHLGGRFRIMGPIEESDVDWLRAYSEKQKAEVRRFLNDGSHIYFVFGPDWETLATDAEGKPLVFERVERVVVIRDGKIIADLSAEPERTNKPRDATRGQQSAATPGSPIGALQR